MKHSIPLVFQLILMAMLTPSLLVAQVREFSDKQGRKIQAEIISVSEEEVSIKTSDGKDFTLKINVFSEEDQQFFLDWKKTNEIEVSSGVDSKVLNEIFGVPLFSEKILWTEDAQAVASRLRWSKESETEFSSSFRFYPKADYRFLGARPYAAVLYGENGKVSELSVIFANKGDSVSLQSSGSKEVREATDMLRKALNEDESKIKDSLKSLGQGNAGTFGSDPKIRERVLVWESNGCSFLLSVQEGEYVGFRIVKPEVAANKGKQVFKSAATVRNFMKAQVDKRDNGDVLIKNIPMVDQGPKGYCVPATFERVFRFLGMSTDMYVLAMAGQTSIGGGTYLGEMIDGIERWSKSQGRKIARKNMEINIRNVKSYIDLGQPIIWGLSSTEPYNKIAMQRTKDRQSVQDMKEWSQKINQEKTLKSLGPDPKAAHVCLIIGYNAVTKEIAVSDSWGPQFSLRWIRADEADAVSQKIIYIVEP